MTDKDVGLFLICALSGFFVAMALAKHEVLLAICLAGVAYWGIDAYVENVKEGPTRPVLTVAAEIAGIVGAVLAFIEFSRR